MRRRITALTIVLLTASWSAAERVPLDPEQLKKESTHIVTGVIKAKYGRDVESKLYGAGSVETQYVVEIEIDAIEKGDELKPKDFVYGRCWRLKKHGALGLVPGPSGHSIPDEGQRVRVYLARGKYSPTGQNDRGFAVVYPNGFETLKK